MKKSRLVGLYLVGLAVFGVGYLFFWTQWHYFSTETALVAAALMLVLIVMASAYIITILMDRDVVLMERSRPLRTMAAGYLSGGFIWGIIQIL